MSANAEASEQRQAVRGNVCLHWNLWHMYMSFVTTALAATKLILA